MHYFIIYTSKMATFCGHIGSKRGKLQICLTKPVSASFSLKMAWSEKIRYCLHVFQFLLIIDQSLYSSSHILYDFPLSTIKLPLCKKSKSINYFPFANRMIHNFLYSSWFLTSDTLASFFFPSVIPYLSLNEEQSL